MEITDVVANNIEFGCVVASGGSTCGGRFLNECEKIEAGKFLEYHISDILQRMTGGGTTSQMTQDELLDRFDFESARQNFGSQDSDESDVHFNGPALLTDIDCFSSPSLMSLPSRSMTRAHNEFLSRVYQHVDVNTDSRAAFASIPYKGLLFRERGRGKRDMLTMIGST